ncbi:MAG: laccase domain-containing protein [Thermoleophilia bacterium]
MTVPLLRWSAPGPYEVAFSTRLGGVSEGPYAWLNLGLATGDERERVVENRRRLYRALGVEEERAVWPRQVHGARVAVARRPGEEADALWTETPGLALTVVSADCLPVALVRSSGPPAVCLAHVGWRGLLAGLLQACVATLGGEVAAAIGPGIGPCCYEVGDDVAKPARAAFGRSVARRGRLDLPAAAALALRGAGAARVELLHECTACRPGYFFSHRRDGGLTGRQGAVAYVAP